jgi:hypothetical protein
LALASADPAPVVICSLMAILQVVRGPFWSLGNADPSYPYLFGMLNLLNGRTVAIYEHPGVPVQAFGAAILWIAGGLSDPASTTRHVLADPEPYLWLVSLALVGILALSLFVLGYSVFRATGKLWMAALAQSGPALSVSPMLWDTPIVGPETLLMVAALLFASAVVPIAREQAKPRTGDVAMLALYAALGVTTKLTFVPLLIIPPVLFFRRWRSALLWLVIFLASVCVLMFPAHRRFAQTIVWVRQLFWGSGFYGSGARTIVDPAAYFHALRDMLVQNWAVYGLVLIGSITLAVSLWRGGEDKRRLLLALLLLTMLGVSLMAAKSYNPRYLNAGLVLAGLLVAVIAEFHPRRAALAGVIGAVVLGAVAIRDAQRYLTVIAANNRAAVELTELLRTEFVGCEVAPYYVSGDPVYALRFGYDWARVENDPYGQILSDLYGDRLFFDIWERRFKGWRGAVPVADVLKRHPCVIFRGTNHAPLRDDAVLGGYITEECHGGAEVVYVAGRHCKAAFAADRSLREN